MAYLLMTMDDINENVVYVSSKELIKITGVSRSTLHNHIVTDRVNAFRFRNRTYFHPDAASEYEKLFKCGLMG